MHTVLCTEDLCDAQGQALRTIQNTCQVKDMQVYQAFTLRAYATNAATAKFEELSADRRTPVVNTNRMTTQQVQGTGVVGQIKPAPVGAQRYDELVSVYRTENNPQQ